MKVLILGKIKNEDDFFQAEKRIREAGEIPLNPIRVLNALPEEITNSDFIALLIELVRISDKVLLLDGFINDLASSIAYTNAKNSEKEIIMEV